MPKYHNIDTIPAKTFFSILETKDFQQLKPKPKEQGLEQVFVSIYDEFFLKSDNAESKEYLRCTNNIAVITNKINTIKLTLQFYYENEYALPQDCIDEFIKAYEISFGIIIDKNLPFIDEVKRLLTIEIGILENDLAFEQTTFKSLVSTSKKKAFDFEDNIVNLESVLKNNIKESVKLSKYIAYSKLASKLIEKQKK